MKDVTVTLVNESLTKKDIDTIASKLEAQGVNISSVQPYGVITGRAPDSVVLKLKEDKEFFVNDNPSGFKIAPPDSEIQ